MCGVLAILFIAIPALEIYFLIEVGSVIGAPATLAMLIAMGIAGAALARHQGSSALGKLRIALAQGREIGASMIEAALVLAAAVLLLIPGFITDVVGFVLLLPVVRRAAGAAIARRYAARMATGVRMGPFGPPFHGQVGPMHRGRGPTRRQGDEPDTPDIDDPPPPGVIDV